MADMPFFSPSLDLTQAVRDAAFATHQMAYVKTNGKDVITSLQDSLMGSVTSTKYTLDSFVLTPVKSEIYTGLADGPSFCIRRGKGARAGAGKGYERVARVLRATAKSNDMAIVSLVALYQSNAPIWLQATNAEDLRVIVELFKAALNSAAIDLSVRASELRPVCVVTIKDKTGLQNDPFLTSVDADLWVSLNTLFNMTTMRDSKIRAYILHAKEALAETIQQAKDSKVDLNPSFTETLYEDIKEKYHGFNLKRFFRSIIVDASDPSPVLKLVAGAAAIYLVVKGIPAAYRWATTKELTATEKFAQKVRERGKELEIDIAARSNLSQISAPAVAAPGTF